MTHLGERELVDWLEGRLEPARAAHVGGCPRCRQQADDLRATLADVLDDPGGTPSPLFWDHFSARVAAAIREEPAPPAVVPEWVRWMRHPVSAWAAAASVALLMLVTVAWRATLHAPTPVAVEQTVLRPVGAAAPAMTPTAAAEPKLDAEAAWAIVSSAAEGLRPEDAHDAGLSAREGSADEVALELTAPERAELARLLEAELKRSGA